MKAALDATPLTVTTGGIRRYTEELHRALGAAFPGDEFRLLQQPGHVRRWWSTGLPLELVRGRYDVFHGTDFAVPYLPVRPSVMTLHDLSPWRGFPASERVRQRTPWLLKLRLATMVITPTEAVRREACEYFGLPAGRVVAVPEASRAWEHQARIGGGPQYLLFAGTVGPRKNLDTVVEAWREVRRTEPVDLVIAGRGEIAPEPGLRCVGAVPDEDLAELYANAAAFVFPSFYEGFGLPVLEAMSCGTPVITSRDAALVEVSGGAALHADARAVREWVTAIRTVLAAPEPWRAAGLARATQFSWERTARLTYDVYQEAVARFGR